MRCIIIEDEKPAQRLLINYIEKHEKTEVLAVYNDPTEVDYAALDTCDIVFLDIKLPQVSGLEFFHSIPKDKKVIITTAYPDHAVEAFELEIVDYLLKPFNYGRFAKSVFRAQKLIHTNSENKEKDDPEYFFIYADKSFYRIEKQDILFVKAEDNYVSIQTTKKKWLLLSTLKSWREKLSEEEFIKIHQSFIVNKRKIDSINGNRVNIGQFELPVSRSMRNDLIEIIKNG